MKTRRALGSVVILGLLALVLVIQPNRFVSAQQNNALMFIENVGQFPNLPGGETLRFQVDGGQAILSLTDQALWLTVMEPLANTVAVPSNEPVADAGAVNTPQHGVTLKLAFLDANPQPHLEPINRLESHLSYFAGSDPAGWYSDVPVWGGVRYVDLYPGIDLEVTSENGQLVQRFVIKEEMSTAGTSALAGIRWQVEGADSLSLENERQLRLNTAIGEISLWLPQTVDRNGTPVDLSVRPEINGLEITNPFSPTGPEPASALEQSFQIAATSNLLFSTYLGGSSSEDSQGIGVDGEGNVYVTGRTVSPDFPTTPGALDTELTGIHEIYIAKLNPTGTALEYATFLGGSSSEFPYDLAVDEAGYAYVTGVTHSSDFPITSGAYDSTFDGSWDVFVIKLNPTGTSLEYATFLGSSDRDDAYSLAIDQAGSAYVTGMTFGDDFPTSPDAFQSALGGESGSDVDAFAAKLSPDGSDLVYGTYLGGNSTDQAWGIAVDAEGNAYLTGKTESSDFPVTPGAFQTDFRRIFVAKLNSDGSDLAYSTFLGGNGYENAWGIAVDESGQAYVAGETTSSNFPTTPDAYQPTYHTGSSVTREGDAFVTKFNAAGTDLIYSTFIGDFDRDLGFDLAIDSAGRAYVTGVTYSVGFPTTADAIQSTPPGYPDAFVAKLNAAGSDLTYSTYLGASFGDIGYAIAANNLGQVYVTGFTNGSDFPTTSDAFDPTYNSGQDAYVTKLDTGNEPEPEPTPTPVPTPDHTCGPTPLGEITVDDAPRGIDVDPSRDRVYVAHSSHVVSVIDSTTNTVLQTISVEDPVDVAYDATNNIVWVSSFGLDQVIPIQVNDDATSFEVLDGIDVGNGPWGIAYNPVNNAVYVVNNLDESVSVIDASTKTVTATVTEPFHQPWHLAVNSMTGKVYVANSGHNSATVIDGTEVSSEVQLWDSGSAYGIAVDETRDTIYVATVHSHRIVAIGWLNGQPDQFLGWASFQRGYNPNRPIPLRAIAVNPERGPDFDGGHLWATTSTGDGSEQNQALFIPKGWSSRFHVPLPHSLGEQPTEGIAVDRVHNRVYFSSGTTPGTITVIGDHDDVCGGIAPAAVAEESDEIGMEVYSVAAVMRADLIADGIVDIFDLVYVASRYDSGDPTADLNEDGTVDIFDLVMIAGLYDQRLPGVEE